ncbi:NAD(P)-dependent oxidoreductase [Paenibacillus sp. WLX1005]|uniref:NAD(P)-dependent oxidoreductase n=1 Tax=Paenibacillus sp. WLX1005 TaxID=3243766 RepID=UPI0039845BE0
MNHLEYEPFIGFIGTGSLGFPIAENMLKSGASLRIYNRTQDKARTLEAYGAVLVSSPADAIPVTGGILISVVSDDQAMQQIVDSEQFWDNWSAGGIHVCMSTLSEDMALAMAKQHASHGVQYVSAPVFGRPEAARRRQLSICLSGSDSKTRSNVQALLQSVSQSCFDFGDRADAAILVKLCGNYMISAAASTMADVSQFISRKGLNPHEVNHMLTSTLFNTPIYQNYGKIMADQPDGFQMNWTALKDLDYFRKAHSKIDSQSELANVLYNMFHS